MDNKYKIITEIRCSICGKEQHITTEVFAPNEAVATDWVNRSVEQGDEFAAFERKHSKHKNIDKYKEVSIS